MVSALQYLIEQVPRQGTPSIQGRLREPAGVSHAARLRDFSNLIERGTPVPELFPNGLLRLSLDDRKDLLRYVRRLLGSQEGSEDIVQEALLRTYEHSASVVEPRAFAFTAARNLAADRRRHTRLAKTDSLGDLSTSHVVASGENVEGGVLAEEEAALLREAAQQLSPQCRIAFTLRVFHGCSYKEIAQQLGLSPKTVENHIARGLRATHEYLRQRYQLT